LGAINKLFTLLFGLFFRPFHGLAPIWALLAISFVGGIVMLWIFGKVSNQDRIRVVRDKIRGNLIGIRLFGDDLAVLFRLQLRILGQTGLYLGLALLPMVILLLPVFVMITQMNLRFAAAPLAPGQAAVVKVELRGESPLRVPVELEVPDGVVVETPGVRIMDPVENRREVAWRIRADRAGEYRLVVKAAGHSEVKRLRVGSSWGDTSSMRPGSNLWEVLLWPGEAPLPGSSPIASIEVAYPDLPLTFLFWNVNALPEGWLIFFVVASVVFGYAFKGPLGVEI